MTAGGDPTARTRIRDAAMDLCGREGASRATVRAVAEAAGVSAALVVHHYGSKAGLVRACDEHLLAVVREGKRQSLRGGAPPSVQSWLAGHPDALVLLRYLARAVADGSDAGRALVDGLVEDATAYLAEAEADGVVRPTRADPRARAALLVGWGLSLLVLGPHLARQVGVEDPLSPELLTALALPATEVYTHGLFHDDRFLRAALAGEEAGGP